MRTQSLVRALSALAVGFVAAVWPVAAASQESTALLIEAARDPGRADVAATARSLAMGGIASTSGSADDALRAPAALLLARGIDAVFSMGSGAYGRNELRMTPSELPPWQPERVPSGRSWSPIGYGAIAARRGRWALAGFFDGTQRFEHAYSTERASLGLYCLYGLCYGYDATGHADVGVSVIRFGGAGAVAIVPDRFFVGGAAYVAVLDYHATARLDRYGCGNTYTDFTIRCATTPTAEPNQVRMSGRAPGFVLSATVKPVRQASVTVRWQHEPSFDGVREQQTTGSPPERRDVQFAPPRVLALTTAVTAGHTILSAEVAAIGYGAAFGPALVVDPLDWCIRADTSHCPGWGFSSHRTQNAAVIRFGGEQALAAGRGRLLLRGGFAYEQAYTLARSATDPARTGPSLPVAPAATPFEPPRAAARWLSAGAAYAWRSWEVGAGVARAGRLVRVAADLRVRIE